MRTRVSAAVVTGALALTGLAVPAATAAPAAAPVPVKITDVKVNGGKDVVVGTTAKKTFTITFTASHPAGIDPDALIVPWRGSDVDAPESLFLPEEWGVNADDCKKVTAAPTTSNCKATIVVDPTFDLDNKDAASWKTEVSVSSKYSDSYDTAYYDSNNLKSFRFQRAAKLTANASPEPVTRGANITVTGALTRANWETSKYAGYTAQPVKLQYKKTGATTWTTVKTINSDSRGNLKTTVKATADGSYRYSFAGTSTTPAINSSADAIDVR
ncbi:calcium-binding protein [Streptomyces sp. JNUCC 64]